MATTAHKAVGGGNKYVIHKGGCTKTQRGHALFFFVIKKKKKNGFVITYVRNTYYYVRM